MAEPKKQKQNGAGNLESDEKGIYNALTSIMHAQELTYENIVSAVLPLMQIAEPKPQHGVDKKYMVLQALKDYVRDTTTDVQKQQVLLLMIDTVLDEMIDMFISIDKKEIMIHMRRCKRWFTKSCCC